jgi:hypothetical protein
MRKWVAATLLVASCTLAHAQDVASPKEAPADKSGSWWTRMFSFGGKSEPDKEKTAESDKKKTEAPPAPESATAQQARATKDLNRHNQVCLKLREIAIITNDAVLLHKVEELEDRAMELYNLRNSNPNLDVHFLEKNLPIGASALRNSTPLPGTGQAKANVREDQR